jgi:hypothetical protein
MSTDVMKRIGYLSWEKACEQPEKIADLVLVVDSITVEWPSWSDKVLLIAHFDYLPTHAWEIFDDIRLEE